MNEHHCIDGCGKPTSRPSTRCQRCAGLEREAAFQIATPLNRTWHTQASCYNTQDPRAFPEERTKDRHTCSHQIRRDRNQFIKDYCEKCPVTAECRHEAETIFQDSSDVSGVWAGIDWNRRSGELKGAWAERVGVTT